MSLSFEIRFEEVAKKLSSKDDTGYMQNVHFIIIITTNTNHPPNTDSQQISWCEDDHLSTYLMLASFYLLSILVLLIVSFVPLLKRFFKYHLATQGRIGVKK